MVPMAGDVIPGFFEDVLPYSKSDMWADLLRVTHNKTDRELSTILIDNSFETIKWAHEYGGIPMEPASTLSGINVGNRIKWQKGAIIRAEHEGIGLSTNWFKTTEKNSIEIRYETGADDLRRNKDGGVTEVIVKGPDGLEEISSNAVVLACGGFEANAQWRSQYLAAPWDHAKVRGTAHNQGDGLRMALAIGALPWGQWSGKHSTPISNEWPGFADRGRTDKSYRLSYPYGVMINRNGYRFCDEGEDVGLYTYAKYGGEILKQPGSLAWQIFDRKTIHLLEPRYSTSDPVKADTLQELVELLEIDDKPQAVKTLHEYNENACEDEHFDPTKKDGLSTTKLSPNKTNWAVRLDSPPFVAYSATGGITFTFGELKVDEDARVIGTDWRPIPHLSAAEKWLEACFISTTLGEQVLSLAPYLAE